MEQERGRSMSPPINTDSLELWTLCGYIAVASWLTIIWDGIITFDDEVRYVWAMPRTAHIKWLYFFGKYFAWAFQTSVLGFQVGYLSHYDVSLQDCRVYRLVEMVANALLMLSFDAVLLLRIFGLYGWWTWSSAIASFGVLLEFSLTIVSAVSTIPTASYDSKCAMIQVPKTIFVFVVGTFVSQAILVWLAYRRRERTARARSTVACVTIRDGLLVFVCFAVFLVVIFIWTLHDSPVTTLMIFFVPLVTCISTCRIILNLQSTHLITSPEFTTGINGLYGSADSFLLSDGPFERRGPC